MQRTIKLISIKYNVPQDIFCMINKYLYLVIFFILINTYMPFGRISWLLSTFLTRFD